MTLPAAIVIGMFLLASCSSRAQPGHSSSTLGPGQHAASAVTCPNSAQLLTAWNAAPADVRKSSNITGFTDIRCWKNWAGAVPSGTPSLAIGGFVFYSLAHGLHVVTSPPEFAELKQEICTSSSTAPLQWAGPVCNIQ